MGRDRAAYMREYRARKRTTAVTAPVAQQAIKRIMELEAEVSHLNAELAKRPTMNAPHRRPAVTLEDWGTQPVRAVPKKR